MKNFLKINRALVAKKKITFLFALLCASVMGWAATYCDYPTGHENNADFGNPDARILLSLSPTGNANEYMLTIKPNYDNGATQKLDYLYVIAGGNTPYPAEAGKDEGGKGYDALTVTFRNTNATTSFTIQWSNPNWGGRWQCTLTDVNLAELTACAAPAPSTATPVEEYDVNFALASNGAYATGSTGVAALAIDGNEGSRWESSATNDETWTLNMGQKRIFNTIKIKWENAYCKEYDLTYSNDGETWSPLYTETNLTQAGWQTIELENNVTAQYIKYHGTKRATDWGQSFFEFQVLLPGVSVLTSIGLEAAAKTAIIGGTGVALTPSPKDQMGNPWDEAVSYEITPAAAGHMDGNTYIPDYAGLASIVAYIGDIRSNAVEVLGTTSANLALSTNISTDNKIIAQSEFSPNGTNAFFAVDGNMGSVWQGSPTNGNVDDSRVYDCWFVVDLGAFYNIDMVALHFEGACSELYHIDFSEDNSTWNLGYNLVGAEGINARNDYWTALDNNLKVRYVRFWSTKSATGWGMKMYEFEVYGTEWQDTGDTEAPVMVSASLVSSTATSAVIAVNATDNVGVFKYHVVDATNGIDANYYESEGNITITGLTHSTAYNFTITAIDAANHESENSKAVAVTTPFDGSINLALNKTSEVGYDDGNPAELAGAANDGADNTAWVTYANQPAAVEWWVVDLGEIYNLTNITALWGGDYSTNYILQARVEAPSAADKADDAAWVTLATVTGAAANAEKSTDVSGVGRYVRFRSVTRSGVCIRLRELRVYGSGIAQTDTEAPVMTSASLVSNTDSHALIAVAATDNQGVAKYRAVDADNNIDGYFVAEAGQITVAGLTGGTHYTLVITAVDFFGNESANSKSVEVTTTAHYTQPQAACPAPTWPADQVKAAYSPTYNANCNLGEWGSGTTVQDSEFGKQFTVGPNGDGGGYFGMVDFSLNCLMMEKLHFDIWVADDMSVRFVPIWGGAEQGVTRNLVGQQWNSIDIDMTAYTGINDWSNVYQIKLDQMPHSFDLWVANAYFYREAAIVDSEAPTNVSASKVAEGFHSISISAQAEDNSGAVSFKVMNGEDILATGAAATGVATTIVVSGLLAGTAYNFNVVAYDEAGNEADPVAVAAATKALPAPAPAPDLNGKKVVNVFSDAMEGSKTIHSGGWGETTLVEWLDIASGDKVFYGRNFNYAGWHSWGSNIDATGMTYLHVDVYSTGMTQVSVTPISEGHEGVANITLTPNAWTSADIALSEYAANNIDWSAIFQFKFMGAVGGNELLIDNVYFYRPVDYTRSVTAGRYGTICLPQAGEMVGATLYEVAYLDNAANKIFFDEVLNGEMIAGRPYIFQPNGATIEVYYTDDAVESAGNYNGLHGFIGATADATFEIPKNAGCYILQNNQYREVQDGDAIIRSNRAYFKIGSGDDCVPTNAVAPAPGRRRVSVGAAVPQVATGMENLSAGDQPVKLMIDGQLYILRGEKLYNVNGQVVK